MEIPEFWAEARQKHRDKSRQITVRRFGWSNVSLEDAQSQAEKRASEALAKILAGADLDRREPRVAYNGAVGMPIREEVLSRFGEHVITRNSYGAHCLNTPNALFADIDFHDGLHCRQIVQLFIVIVIGGIALAWWFGYWGALIYASLILLILYSPLFGLALDTIRNLRGGHVGITRRRLERFLGVHPDWNFRLYATPKGLRVLVTHRPFEPDVQEVHEFFHRLRVDWVYQRMCKRQRCFRARLTPKPWRVGIKTHMRPRPGVWPVAPERMPERTLWIQEYEVISQGFAACHYLESLGSGSVDPRIREVIELHDRLSKAMERELPLA